MVCGHHIIRKKAGGPDLPWNLIPLCWQGRNCHDRCHRLGEYEFSAKVPSVKEWLINNGWILELQEEFEVPIPYWRKDEWNY